MERPIWFLPLACLGAGLGLSLLALVPLLHTPQRATSTIAAAPVAPSPPAIGAPPAGDASSYQIEIDSLRRRAQINEDTGKQMRDIGAPDRAVELLQEASRMIEASQCLHSQSVRGVPFYEGKAVCAVAMPAGD